MKGDYVYSDREDYIIADEFGDTTAPNPIIDDPRYFESGTHYPSIFSSHYKDGKYQRVRRENVAEKVIFQNKEVQRRNEQQQVRNNILSALLEIDELNPMSSSIYNKHRVVLRKISLKRFKNVVHYFLAWQTSPCLETRNDWRRTRKNYLNEPYLKVMYEILKL